MVSQESGRTWKDGEASEMILLDASLTFQSGGYGRRQFWIYTFIDAILLFERSVSMSAMGFKTKLLCFNSRAEVRLHPSVRSDRSTLV